MDTLRARVPGRREGPRRDLWPRQRSRRPRLRSPPGREGRGRAGARPTPPDLFPLRPNLRPPGRPPPRPRGATGSRGLPAGPPSGRRVRAASFPRSGPPIHRSLPERRRRRRFPGVAVADGIPFLHASGPRRSPLCPSARRRPVARRPSAGSRSSRRKKPGALEGRRPDDRQQGRKVRKPPAPAAPFDEFMVGDGTVAFDYEGESGSRPRSRELAAVFAREFDGNAPAGHLAHDRRSQSASGEHGEKPFRRFQRWFRWRGPVQFDSAGDLVQVGEGLVPGDAGFFPGYHPPGRDSVNRRVGPETAHCAADQVRRLAPRAHDAKRFDRTEIPPKGVGPAADIPAGHQRHGSVRRVSEDIVPLLSALSAVGGRIPQSIAPDAARSASTGAENVPLFGNENAPLRGVEAIGYPGKVCGRASGRGRCPRAREARGGGRGVLRRSNGSAPVEDAAPFPADERRERTGERSSGRFEGSDGATATPLVTEAPARRVSAYKGKAPEPEAPGLWLVGGQSGCSPLPKGQSSINWPCN